MKNDKSIWIEILSYIKSHHTEALVNVWFDDVEMISLNNDMLVLYTPNDYKRPVLEKHCIPFITEAMLAIEHRLVKVIFIESKDTEEYNNPINQDAETEHQEIIRPEQQELHLAQYRDVWQSETVNTQIGIYTREFYCLDNF